LPQSTRRKRRLKNKKKKEESFNPQMKRIRKSTTVDLRGGFGSSD